MCVHVWMREEKGIERHIYIITALIIKKTI